MYRVKAEAVSGTKIFAGGKWLQCIGNKKVSVGEYIWTDGRCVYGNYQESQQPIVITTPKADDAIPIVLSTNAYNYLPLGKPDLCFYTFRKGKLHLEAKTELPRRKPSNYTNPVMLNDYKKNIFFRDDNIIDSESNYIQLLAANINRSGERFEIIEKTSKDGEACSVEIRKNGDVVKTFDITEFHTANIWNECPEPPYCPFVRADINAIRILEDAFIEDEKQWRFAFTGKVAKAYSDEYIGPYPSSGEDPNFYPERDVSYSLTKSYLFTAEGTYLLSGTHGESFGYGEKAVESGGHFSSEATKAKLFLQDGHYYKLRFALVGDYDNNMYYSDFFTPTGEKIFSTENLVAGVVSPTFVDGMATAEGDCRFLLRKIRKNTYLFSAADLGGGGGLWLIRNGTATKLLHRSKCFNQRLRPMTKYKNWQNRLQELTLT